MLNCLTNLYAALTKGSATPAVDTTNSELRYPVLEGKLIYPFSDESDRVLLALRLADEALATTVAVLQMEAPSQADFEALATKLRLAQNALTALSKE